MNRYSKITKKIAREIVLLKGKPCKWGKCTFCDYILDNSNDEAYNHNVNVKALECITGEYGVLEVINSGNVFELPAKTLDAVRGILINKGIHTLFFEAHWIYRKHLERMRDYFGVRTIVKTGVESFHRDFREGELNKGFDYKNIEELCKYFDSVCLMVGIEGQTKDMIIKDIQLAMEHFSHFTVNVFVENTTSIKSDKGLIQWFQQEFTWLNNEHKCDVLWANTDFGVGALSY